MSTEEKINESPGKFRKKPVVIEAMLWTGRNFGEAVDFLGEDFGGAQRGPGMDQIAVLTLEGPMTASLGDWLIRGVKGEHYPCKPDVFALTYEAVDS